MESIEAGLPFPAWVEGLDGVLTTTRIVLVQRVAHRFDRRGLVELHDHRRSAGELDPFGQPLCVNGEQPRKDDNP